MARQAFALAALLFLAGPAGTATAGQDSAHTLAQQFAGDGTSARKAQPLKNDDAKRRAAAKAREAARIAADAKRRADEARRTAERLKADEADMLERARAEARERREEQLRAQAEIERAERHEAEARSRAALAAADARRKRDGDRAYASDDDEATKAAERHRARRLRAEALRAAAERAREREAARLAEVERRVREEDARAREAERLSREAEQRRLAEEREAEAAAAEARRAEEEFRRYGNARGFDDDDGDDEDVPSALADDRDPAFRFDTRVTVLLIMTPGHRGIRLFKPNTADPMVCVGSAWCYISTGAATPARQLARGRAFGPGVALGRRAGACRNSLGCIFRDVDLGADNAWLQPIDLRILRHDRRETRPVSPDHTCAFDRRGLSCAETVSGAGYRAWIVPEHLARRAGAERLAEALERGLDD